MRMSINKSVRMFPVSEGLLEHRRRMGSAIWEYLWLVAHVTSDEPGRDGKFLGIVDRGNVLPTSRIAADLQRSRAAALANLERLAINGYIQRTAAAGHAY